MAGLFVILSPYLTGSNIPHQKVWIIGGGASFIGLVLTQSFSGILIDPASNRMKEYFSFLGFKTGEWQQLPKITQIKILKTTREFTNTPNGISPTLSGRFSVYSVHLINDDLETAVKLDYSKKQKAVSKANELAARFNVAVT